MLWLAGGSNACYFRLTVGGATAGEAVEATELATTRLNDMICRDYGGSFVCRSGHAQAYKFSYLNEILKPWCARSYCRILAKWK
jgi:hypothetical protein